jgi:hypothetical protein
VLTAFARNYDRKMELHLESLGVGELVDAAKTDLAGSDGGWRREAYVQRLADLDEVCADIEIWPPRCTYFYLFLIFGFFYYFIFILLFFT